MIRLVDLSISLPIFLLLVLLVMLAGNAIKDYALYVIVGVVARQSMEYALVSLYANYTKIDDIIRTVSNTTWKVILANKPSGLPGFALRVFIPDSSMGLKTLVYARNTAIILSIKPDNNLDNLFVPVEIRIEAGR